MSSEPLDPPSEIDCSTCEDLFSEAFEQSLLPSARAAFENHRNACSRCRRDYETFVESVSLLRSHEPRPLPANFVESLRARITDSERSAWNRPSIAWGIAAASLLLLGLSLVFLREVPAPVAPALARDEKAPPVLSHSSLETRTALVVRRGERFLHVSPGTPYVPRAGDVIEALPAEPRIVEVVREVVKEVPGPSRFEVRLDTAPLASLLREGFEQARRIEIPAPSTLIPRERSERLIAWLGARLTEAFEEWDSRAATSLASLPPQEPLTPAPPLSTVREGGSVRLEVRGRLDDVIPELILCLDSTDTARRALARSRLEQIQRQLAYQHGIPGPDREARIQTNDPSPLESLARVLDRTSSEPLLEPVRATKDWRTWWNRHRERIRRLDTPVRDRERASI